MRRYDIVSAILLILSIIGFALAAPVLVQEKRQACVDVVHIPKDVATVLGKRADEELEKLVEEYFKMRPIDSSDSHASSSSAPPGPDRGSTNVVQSPTPNPGSSTANPEPSMEPSSPSSTAAIPDSFADRFNEAWGSPNSQKGSDTSLEPMFTPGSSEYGSDDDLEWATAHAPKGNPIPIPAGADPSFDWNYWRDVPSPPKSSSPNAGPSTVPGADPHFDWNYWMDVPSPPKLSFPEKSGQVPEHQMGPVQQPNAVDDSLIPAPPKEVGPGIPWPDDPWNQRLTTKLGSDPNLMAVHQPPPYPLSSTEFHKDHDVNTPLPDEPSPTDVYSYPGSVAPPSLPDARLPTESEPEDELHSDHQSSIADSEPDPQAAAIYAAKGKAKQLRRISGTARDVGNAAQRELRPAERSLDPVE